MPAPKKRIDCRKCDWSMANIEPLNHDTFNHMTYYAHVWEENQWEGMPIFEKKTNGKKNEHIDEHVVFVCYFSARLLCYKKKPSHRTSNSCFFQSIPQLTHIFPSNCSNQAHPLVSLLPERTETVRGMGQTKLAVQIHMFIIIYIGV